MIDNDLSRRGQIFIVGEVDFGYITRIHQGRIQEQKYDV